VEQLTEETRHRGNILIGEPQRYWTPADICNFKIHWESSACTITIPLIRYHNDHTRDSITIEKAVILIKQYIASKRS